MPASTPTAERHELRTSELVAALTYALDLTEGQPPGHVLRSCLLGMAIGERLGLGAPERASLFWALLLKDAGCSSNASRVYALLDADDQHVKRSLKTVDWPRFSSRARYAFAVAAPDRTITARIRRVAWLARQGDLQAQVVGLRCERGAEIAQQLGLPERTSAAIRALDEHWDGHGRPYGLRGEEIPLLSRIMCLAQTVEVFHGAGGRPAAYAMARERRGRWFDPRVVDALEDMLGDAAFWRSLDADAGELERFVAAFEPPDLVRMASDAEIDGIVGAFAGIVDAKSPFTYHHSERVADISQQLGDALGLQAAQLAALRRVALLHDLGKLALPNRILDRDGPLNDRERALVQQHPAHSERILERVPVLSSLAATAGAHHERLDGSGYPRGLTAGELALPARILAVADVYEALTSERPYRGAMSAGDALGVVRAEAVEGRLARDVVGVLETSAG